MRRAGSSGADPALNPELPLLLLGVPVVDTLMVMTVRLAEGARRSAATATTCTTSCWTLDALATTRRWRSCT
ncbi:MAG: hypothetical protein IPM60_05695 [Rhodospirillales bacterium]|nr:hypothetical protein [Rhodospirillales bacterium]